MQRGTTSVRRPGQEAENVERYSKDYAAPLTSVRWAEVQRCLAACLPPDAVHTGHRCTGYSERDGAAGVVLHFEGQPDVHAQMVVGADGVRCGSRVLISSCLTQNSGP